MSFTLPHPSVPASTLTNGNEEPSENELAMLQGLLHQHNENKTALDQEIQRLEHLLMPLRMKRYETELQIARNNSVLKSIRRVPDDVLREIFSACATSVLDIMCSPHPFDSLQPEKEPWTLSLVCKRWRVVVIDTPKLWSSIGLDFTGHMAEPLRSRGASMLACQINRARLYPITLSIYIEPADTGDLGSHPFVSALSTDLLKRCVNFRAFASAKALLTCPSLQGDVLCNVAMVGMESKGTSDEDKELDIFAHIKDLRHVVVFSTLTLPWTSKVPLTQLVSYTACWASINSLQPLVKLAHAAPSLKALSITCSVMSNAGRWDSQNTILFPSLENLQLIGLDTVQLGSTAAIPILFSAFQMPSLNALEITCGMDTTTGKSWEHALLPVYNAMDVVPITKLTVELPPNMDYYRAVRGIDMGMKDFLRMTPNVVDATFKLPSDAAVIQCMSALCIHVLPELKTLTLNGPGAKLHSADRLLITLKERLVNNTSPMTLRLDKFPITATSLSARDLSSWKAFVGAANIRVLSV